MKFDDLVTMADKMMMFKYIIKNVAKQVRQDGHLHAQAAVRRQRLRHAHAHLALEGRRAAVRRQRLRRPERHGHVRHRRHAQARPGDPGASANPTTNSYKRLVPGFEAPVNLAYSQRNRSAAVRIPMYSPSPKAKRLEFRCPDPSCNPYLAFSAILMAAIDGIQNKIDPGEPLDKDIYDLDAGRAGQACRRRPARWKRRSTRCAKDHEFLLRGDVFTPDVIDTWIWYKTVNEVAGHAVASASLRVLLVLRHLDFHGQLGDRQPPA